MKIFKNKINTGRFIIPYRIYGNKGDVIVCVNGAQQTMASWRSFVSHVTDKFCVVVFDFPGHGRGQIVEGSPDITIQEQLHILNEIIKASTKSRKINLAGASWGSIIAALYSSTYPERVKKVVMAGFGLTVNKKLSEIIKKGKKLADKNKKEELAEYLIEEIGSQLPNSLKSRIVNQFINMKKEHLMSFYSHSDFVNNTERVDRIINLKNIQAETLLLIGQNDTIVEQADVEQAAKMIPNCKFMILKNAGHFLHFENKNILPIYKEFYEKRISVDC